MSRLAVVERTKLNLQDVTILVQGGSELELEMLSQVFAGFGARQLRRADGLPAMREMLKGDPVDLVVMDVAGGLDASLEVVRELRRRSDAVRFAPVVLTTGHVTSSMLLAARDAGVSYVVAKPLSPRVLFERLVWIVRDARPFVEAASYAGPDRRVRVLGPPAGVAGRREGDISGDLGEAVTPNLDQSDIDAMMNPVRKAL